ncbi:MAG: nucleoside deaminase [Granulosicoccus sp.]
MELPDPDSAFVSRLLDAIEVDILPLTAKGVAAGNKVFGAALLTKQTLETVVAETNNEIESPLHHGEMHALKRFYEIPAATRPTTDSLIFLSTHEPCSLCLSAITWSGFDNFYYLFSHEDSRDSFAIPHDLNILKEVFDVDPGGYRQSNTFWESHSIRTLIAQLPTAEQSTLNERVKRIIQQYDVLSSDYQSSKSDNDIPLD